MSTFQGEVTQASRDRILDTSNSRKIHFGTGWLHIIITIEQLKATTLKVAARAASERRRGLPAFFLFTCLATIQ